MVSSGAKIDCVFFLHGKEGKGGDMLLMELLPRRSTGHILSHPLANEVTWLCSFRLGNEVLPWVAVFWISFITIEDMTLSVITL